MASIPNPNPITNVGYLVYQYSPSPSSPNINSAALTNIVSTTINIGMISNIDGGFIKAVDKAYETVFSTLTYTITLKNTGNVAVTDLTIIDTIPNNTLFVTNSLTVDGSVQTGSTIAPPSGFALGTMQPNQTKTITFQVVVISIPNPNPIPNSAIVSYKYTTNPATPDDTSATNLSNSVNTQINIASINNPGTGTGGDGFDKTVDKAYAKLGDQLTYTLVLKNTGNVTATNIIIKDTVPAGTTFVSNSLTVDSVSKPGQTVEPPTGYAFGTLAPGALSTVTFKVLVVSVPAANPIQNAANVTYDFTKDPASPDSASGSGNSSSAQTSITGVVIDNSNGSLVKYADKSYTTVFDTLTYTIVVKNTGTTAANNLVITDTTPSGTTFITGSLTRDGAPVSGSLQPPTGYTISSLANGTTTTFTYKVFVNTLPTINPIANSCTANYTYTVDPASPNGVSGSGNSNVFDTAANVASIDNVGTGTGGTGFTKTASKQFAKVSDVITYTLALKNTGNVTANNVLVIDTLPNGTTFVANSLIKNGVSQPSSTVEPPTGYSIASIAPNEVVTLTFDVTVISIPSPNPINNTAGTTFDYIVDPSLPAVKGSGASNGSTTQVNTASIDSTGTGTGGNGFTKSSDKSFVKVGDVITYTLALKNTGNVAANNLKVIDTVPSGTSFVAGSITKDGAPQAGTVDPPTGFTISTLAAGATTTLTFKVSVDTIPTINPIQNIASVDYTYTVDPSVPNGASATGSSNPTDSQVNSVKIDSSNGSLMKYASKQYADVYDTISYSIVVKNLGNVTVSNILLIDTTPNGTMFIPNSLSQDGTPLTGKSLEPPTGYTISSLSPAQVTTLTYMVVVYTIPSPNPISNILSASYQFSVDPTQPPETGTGGSNPSNTQVNTASIDKNGNGTGGTGFTKYNDKPYTTIGETINYTLVLKNTGNTTANNIYVIDTIPYGLSFVAGSLNYNGVNSSSSTVLPPTGYSITSLSPGQVSTITFKALVVTIPTINPMGNVAATIFDYTVDPSVPNGKKGSGTSNVSDSQLNVASIDNLGTGAGGNGFTKIPSKAYSKVGDTITYTLALTNTGNVSANNIKVTDTTPYGTIFVPNTFDQDGVNMPGSSLEPPTGYTITTLAPGATTTLTYNVVVVTLPTVNPITNNATVNFVYTKDPAAPDGQTAGGNSNGANTNVNTASITYPGTGTGGAGFTKFSNKQYAKVNDVITYSLVLKNTGNVTASNIVVIDTLPSGTTFVANSLTYNGAPQSGATILPPTGYTVPSLAPNKVATITFNVTVVSIPSPNPLDNSAGLTFDFIVDPTQPPVKGDGVSDHATSQINTASIDNTGTGTGGNGFTKLIDPKYVGVNDIVTYTLILTNTGNVAANNIVVTDTIAYGTSFIANSLTKDGVAQSGQTIVPPTGFAIPTLAPGQTTTLTFKALVTTIPSVNPIANNASLKYSYTMDPASPNGVNSGGNSNSTNATVNYASIDSNSNTGNGFKKICDKTYAKIGDTLTYTLILKNTGNIAATNLLVVDTIPASESFIENTVTIDGSPSSDNPNTGINISSLASLNVATITFKVTVITLPTLNPVSNQAIIGYNYTKDPSVPNGATGNGVSTISDVQLKQATIDNADGGFIKSVDKPISGLYDIITYTISLKNTGNVVANNLVLQDTLPNGTSLVPGSVTLDGAQSYDNPQTGIVLGSLAPNTRSTITFKIKVDVMTVPNPISNTALISYTFTVDPSLPNGISTSNNSNTVDTQLNSPQINPQTGGFNKYVDKPYAQIGETVTYSIVIKNKGNVNANAAIVYDTIPAGTLFVNSSVYVNSVNLPGTNPQTGIPVGAIAPNNTLTLTFSVVVNSIPVINPVINQGRITYSYNESPGVTKTGDVLSNTIPFQVNDPGLFNSVTGSPSKQVDKAYAIPGDQLTYTIIVANKGNVSATNVIVYDTVPSGTSYVSNSTYVNNVPGNQNPTTGIPVGSISVGNITTITFSVSVVSVPLTNPLPNQSFVAFKFTKDPAIVDGVSGFGGTNIVSTTITDAIYNTSNGRFVKSVDKTYIAVGDVLTYTIVIKNTGNVAIKNVILKDTIPTGTSLVSNSLTVNGTPNSGDIQAGINLGTINVGQVVTTQFKVTINSIENPNVIANSAVMDYTYTSDPSKPDLPGVGLTDEVKSTVNTAIINNSDGNGLIKTADKTYAKIGDTITYGFVLTNTGNVSADNVMLFDTLPNYVLFSPGSALVNGNPASGSPTSGINIGVINPGAQAIVAFTVMVTTIPPTNSIVNQGRVAFTYTANPSLPNGKSGNGISNNIGTTINYGVISNQAGGFIKSVDKANAGTNDILTYTLTIKNTGNVPVTNVTIIDTIPSGTVFNPGSLMINNVVDYQDITTGADIGIVQPNQVVTVSFKVTVITIPTINPTTNQAYVGYNYTVDPSIPDGARDGNLSNKVPTQVNSPNIGTGNDSFRKSVDKSYVSIGDTITFTIEVENKGNIAANGVVVYDTIPYGTNLISNTLLVNSTPTSGSPQGGVSIGTILPGNTVTVAFKVMVNSMPSPNPISNIAKVNYTYKVDANTTNSVSTQSPETLTEVNDPGIIGVPGNFVKSTDKPYAKVGDIITYDIMVKSSGNATATNVLVKDTLPNGTNLVANSVQVDGSPSSDNPETGINLGNIAPGSSHQVQFKVLVYTAPNPNPIQNTANISYNYTVDPNNPNGGSKGGSTDPITNAVAVINFKPSNGTFTKYVSKSYGIAGDTLTYTLVLNNKGNTTANNVVVYDTIPMYMDYVLGSVTVNNSTSSDSPTTGINILSVGVNQVYTIQFKAIISTIPTINPITNEGSMKYQYTVDPSIPNGESDTGVTNKSTTNVNQGYIGNNNNSFNKTVDKTGAALGDTLTYSLYVKNSGNADVNNVVVYDTIPQGTSFIPGSVTIDGSPSSDSIITGVNVGTLVPNEDVIISFKVLVGNTIPSTNPINNVARVTYNYTLDPSVPNGASGYSETNPSPTNIYSAVVIAPDSQTSKQVSTEYSRVGEIVTYTISLKNIGNVTATSLVIIDTIPNDTSFIAGSVTVNGVSKPSDNPQSGVLVGSLAINAVATMTFDVKIMTFPSPNPIPNIGYVVYEFTVDNTPAPPLPSSQSLSVPASNAIEDIGFDIGILTDDPELSPLAVGSTIIRTSTLVTNQVITAVDAPVFNAANGGLNKYASSSYAQPGNTITYTIPISNTGNTLATNVLVRDTLPVGLSFVPNSGKVNGVSQPGADPLTGFNVATLGVNVTATVTFDVLVVSIPPTSDVVNKAIIDYDYVYNPNTQETAHGTGETPPSTVSVSTASFDPATGGTLKTASTNYATVGDTVSYTVVLKNTGNATATNAIFYDTIPTYTKFITNSVTLNGTAKASTNPQTGVLIGTIPSGATNTITFKVLVVSLPDNSTIENVSRLTYNFTPSPGNTITNTDLSKPNSVTISAANISNDPNSPGGPGFNKSSDKDFYKVSDIATYTLSVKNTGNVTATNVMIYDTIPYGTTFVTDSVTINGAQQYGVNPQTGISVGTISANEIVTITFQVTVVTIPTTGKISNTATSTYNFTVDPSMPNGGKGSGSSNTDVAAINSGKTSGPAGTPGAGYAGYKYPSKKYADVNDIIIYTVVLQNTGNVPVNNVVVTDTLPISLQFVAGSATVNGIAKPSDSLSTGISVGTISVNALVTVTFKALVISTPDLNPVTNTAKVDYTFTTDPSVPNGEKGSGLTNPSNLGVYSPNINTGNGSFVKASSPEYADLGDTVTYTLTVKNIGNIPANNVTVYDTIPSGTQFIPDSVTIDGVNKPNLSPATGVNVGSVAVGDSSVVTFMVKVITIPTINPVPDTARVSTNYTVDPSIPNGGSSTALSNTVTNQVNSGVIGSINPDGTNGGPIKLSDKSVADIGDTITYSVILENNGNVPSQNVILYDTIPDGTIFITDSIYQDGIQQVGENPQTGYAAGIIQAGTTSTITFKVKVTTLPANGKIVNVPNISYGYTVNPNEPNKDVNNTGLPNTIPVNTAVISPETGGFIKSANKTFATIGDTIGYTISVKNTGTVTAMNVKITETLPNGTAFVTNSVKVNGTTKPGISVVSGISLGNVAPNIPITVSYSLLVVSVPNPNPIVNTANVSYSYSVDAQTTKNVNNPSNPAETFIKYIDTSDTSKYVDKLYADIGDILSYMILIPNKGNTTAVNVYFKDTIPNGTIFVKNSFYINSIQQSGKTPDDSNLIGNIEPGSNATITFKVQIV